MGFLLIIVLVLAAIAGFFVNFYNGYVRFRNKSEEAWADIDTQLKRRYDLIPNLVETVKGYAKHEEGTFQKITEARTAAMGAQTPAEQAKAENMLSATLKSLFAVAEAYPDLKANTNFLDLQQTLTDIEEKLQLARRYFNGTVKQMNTKIEVFPGNMLAGMFNFVKKDYFEIEDEARDNVKVKF